MKFIPEPGDTVPGNFELLGYHLVHLGSWLLGHVL